MKRLYLAPVAMLLLLSVPHDAAAGPVYVGSVTDVAGDTFSGPDIVSASIVIDDAWFTFSMQFVPGTLDPATTKSSFSVDMDQNAATGAAWNGLGVEFLVSQGYLGSTGTATLSWFNGGPSSSVPVSFLADRVEYSFARSLFGAEDGLLDFIAGVQTALETNVATPIVDFAPNPIAFPASTSPQAAVPEPGTLALLGGGLSLLSRYRLRSRSGVRRG
jgi:hypothetical protein